MKNMKERTTQNSKSTMRWNLDNIWVVSWTLVPRLRNPVLLTHDLTHSFRAHTFSLSEDPAWPIFSFRIAYGTESSMMLCSMQILLPHCFHVGSSRTLFRNSFRTSATFCYAGFSLRKRNSRTIPLCNFIMEILDAAHIWTSASCIQK